MGKSGNGEEGIGGGTQEADGYGKEGSANRTMDEVRGKIHLLRQCKQCIYTCWACQARVGLFKVF